MTMTALQRDAYEHPLAGADQAPDGTPTDTRSRIAYKPLPGGRTLGLSVNK